MSNELMKVGQTYVAKTDGQAFKREAGTALLKVGGAGLALGGLAWMLPFVTLPMLLALAVLTGIFLVAKS